MTRLKAYISEYHWIVHTLMVGTVFTTLTSSMSMPFLAIYLMETTKLDFGTIGAIIGSAPLAATFGGFIGGFLSDMLGRRRLMIISLLFLALSYTGMVMTTNIFVLIAFNVIQGISSSFFAIISKALMGDLTSNEKRYRMFSNRYLAGNIGYTIGPVVGSFIGIGGSSAAFLMTGSFYLCYAIILAGLLKKYHANSSSSSSDGKLNISSVFNVLRKDMVLLLFLIGGVLLTTVHGQMSVTLSQYLKVNVLDGIKLFGILMSINGFTVLLIQVQLTRWSERYSIFNRIAMGGVLFALGDAGFAFSSNWFGFIVSMIVFTIGEILVIPAEYAQIDQITPQGMRGTYYGAQNFNELGNFLGPWAGGIVLSSFGGSTMFLMLSGVSLLSLFFYWKGRQMYENKLACLKPKGVHHVDTVAS